MKVKIYVFEDENFLDLVFVDSDFGVINIECEKWNPEDDTENFDKIKYESLDEFEDYLKSKNRIKLYIGEV